MRNDWVGLAITGGDPMDRLYVASLAMKKLPSVDKVCYISPAVIELANPKRRLQAILDEIRGVCHTKTQKKLLIFD